jgi:mono/diheme cytochrome c family protein
MKKTLKVLGIVLGVLILLIGAVLTYINFTGIPTYEVAQIDYQHVSSPEIVERGKKLTLTLCAGCHKDSQTGLLTGSQMLDAPKEFGKIYSQNITQSKEHGIGNWTDAELLYLLRTGIKPDGQYIPPYMAKLAHMADSDLNAIIAFLRSDDPAVKAVEKADQPSEVSILTKLLTHVAWKPMEMPKQEITLPDSTDKVALGKYLSLNLECFSCHSADFKSNDYANPVNSAGYFGGGNPTLNNEGQVITTSNLTPDPETGIGNWSEEKFINAVKYGIKEGENALRYPMAPFSLLTDYEVSAIYVYLQTIPAIENKVDRVFYEN